MNFHLINLKQGTVFIKTVGIPDITNGSGLDFRGENTRFEKELE